MKKYIIVIFLFFIASSSFAATNYVTQSGAGTKSGADLSNAMGVAEFEADAGSKPNEVYFLNGTITSQIDLNGFYGSAGNTIKIVGSLTSKDPVEDEGITGVGIVKPSGDVYAFYIQNCTYIDITDLDIDGTDSHSTSNGIQILDDSTNIRIMRNAIHHWNYRGLYLGSDVGINDVVTVGGSPGNGNRIYLNGANSASVGGDVIGQNATTNITISYNQIFATGTTYGMDGIALQGVSSALIEYNDIYDHNRTGDGEDGIDLKFSHDVVVRYNKIHGHTRQSGVTVQMGSYNVDVYGNVIYDNKWGGVYIKRGSLGSHLMSGINVWGNILYSTSGASSAGVAVFNTGTNNTMGSVNIFNNTIYNNHGQTDVYSYGGVFLNDGSAHVVKNNVMYNNEGKWDSAAMDYLQVYRTASATFDYNIYYDPDGSGQDMFYDGGTYRTFTEWGQDANGAEDNPDFVNTGTYDFEPDTGSPLIGSGVDMGSGYTLFSGMPDMSDSDPSDWTINLSDPDTAGWPIGAVLVSGAEDAAPEILTSADGYGNACPEGADPITANFWLATDIASYCRGGIMTTNCAADYPGGYDDLPDTYDNPGGTAQGYLRSAACGGVTTVCASCSTELGDSGSESDMVTIARTIAAEEGGAPASLLSLKSNRDTLPIGEIILHLRGSY